MMFKLSVTLASNLLLAPPTEEEIKTKIEAAMTFFREKGDDFSLEDPEFHAVLDAQLEGVDPAAATSCLMHASARKRISQVVMRVGRVGSTAGAAPSG